MCTWLLTHSSSCQVMSVSLTNKLPALHTLVLQSCHHLHAHLFHRRRASKGPSNQHDAGCDDLDDEEQFLNLDDVLEGKHVFPALLACALSWHVPMPLKISCSSSSMKQINSSSSSTCMTYAVLKLGSTAAIGTHAHACNLRPEYCMHASGRQ